MLLRAGLAGRTGSESNSSHELSASAAVTVRPGYGVAGPGFGVGQSRHKQVKSTSVRRPGGSVIVTVTPTRAGTGKSCTAHSRPGRAECGPEQATASRLQVERGA